MATHKAIGLPSKIHILAMPNFLLSIKFSAPSIGISRANTCINLLEYKNNLTGNYKRIKSTETGTKKDLMGRMLPVWYM